MSDQYMLRDVTTEQRAADIPRGGAEVKSALLFVTKTGSGTCSVSVKESRSGAIVANIDIPATTPLATYVEFPIPASCYIELSAITLSVVVSAWVDGWGA